MDLKLSNKRVLITGSSRGIGKEIAAGFLKEGAKVFLISRNLNDLINAKRDLSNTYSSNMVEYCVCDCNSIDSLCELGRKIEFVWGGIDILIVNVGDGNRKGDDFMPTPEDWQSFFDGNFTVALNTIRQFLPSLIATKGSIIFISSIAGLEVISAPIAYSAAKASIIAMSKNLARQFGDSIRVNVVAPGNIYFEGGSWDKKKKNNPDKISQILRDTVPMKRFGVPNEISDAVVFLSSERASFITGATLVIDGGQTLGFN